MSSLLNFFLVRYDDQDLLVYHKARCLLILTLAIQAVCLAMLLFYPAVNVDSIISTIALWIILALIPFLILIRAGHYVFAGHAMTCLALAAVWLGMFSEETNNLIGLTDTIVLIMALLMLPSIVTIQRAGVILAYFAVNLVITGFFLAYTGHNWLKGPVLMEYAFDSLMSLSFMMVAAYESFKIHRSALERAQNSEASLKRSEERYRNIFDNIQDIYFELGLDGTLLEVSPSISEITPYTRQQLINRHLSFIYAEHREWQTIISETLKHERVRDLEIAIPFQGKTFYMAINARLIRDRSHQPHKIVGSLRDITARHRVEYEKRELQDQLARSQKMEALGLLAGGVAHDLNNVLSGTVGYPDLMLMEVEPDTPLHKRLTKIRDSGRKAAEIVQDLLTLARRGVMNPKVVNLNRIIDDYLASPECETLELHHPQVSIITDLAPDLPNIKGSFVHLRKTIMNLISNAAEAEVEGGLITISSSSTHLMYPPQGYTHIKPGEYAVITITDNGIGIPEADLKRIFEPFYTKKVMGRSGTGLGMAVVWGTIEDHGGYLTVTSREGRGTTFTLYFPATHEALDTEESAKPIHTYIGHSESVLVVDDIKEQRELASEVLGRLGYRVHAVASGEEAIDYLKDHLVDILILDMLMDPGIDGLETYQRILELKPRQKAILVSGYAENERVRAAQAMGAGTYIRKPYTIEKIGVALRRELGNN